MRVLLWCLFLPLQLLLALTFLLTDTIRWLLDRFREDEALASLGPKDDLCSIVMLNWNGRHLLEQSIPPLLKEVQRSGRNHQVIVVDNGSTDDSVSWLRAHHPGVELLELDKNLGFGEGNNQGVKAARNEIVVLLNNDMMVAPGFLKPLLEPFSDPEVFAVTSQILFPEGRRREETGNTRGVMRRGYLELSHEPLKSYHNRREILPVLWAGGGSSAFHRDRFLQLGGFADIYSPCYLEDTDLSYRAWRRGWQVVLAPKSEVLHMHRSSTKVRFNEDELQLLVEQRKLWYLWSNLQFLTIFPHLLYFPLYLTKKLSVLDYFHAVRNLPTALGRRLREPARVIKDRTIKAWVEHPLTFLDRFQPERRDLARSSGDSLKILIVSAYLPHLGTHGGAGRVFQLLKRTSQHHQVSLITFIEGQRDEPYIAQAEEYCRRVETVTRNHFKPLSFFPYEPFEEFNSPEFRNKLETMLTEEDYDIVHFEWTQMALYADLCRPTQKFLTEIEVNYAALRTLLEIESSIFKRFFTLYRMLHTLYREVEMCRRMDHVICVTEEDKGYLQHYLSDGKLTVINTGVDVEYFRYAPRILEPKSLVFVGAFRHSPNIDAMLYFSHEIFPEILEQEPQAHLYIVGSSPPREIISLEERGNITVTGFVQDIRNYYRKAHVVVVPLRTGVGIRGKILEAWSVGKATVATSLAYQGIRATHGENSLFADTTEEFIEQTATSLRNPEFCRRLGASGRKTVEEFYNWNMIGNSMVDKYEKAAQPGSSKTR